MWCTYGSIFPWGIGKIIEETPTYIIIQYSEKQLYPPEYWDPQYVKKFNTVEEAAKEYIGSRYNTRSTTFINMKIKEEILSSFPSEYKNTGVAQLVEHSLDKR